MSISPFWAAKKGITRAPISKTRKEEEYTWLQKQLSLFSVGIKTPLARFINNILK
jgi:hypothetical protein